MNRREFIAAAAGATIIGTLPTPIVAGLPATKPYCTDWKEPRLVYDQTTGHYHGHRCYSQWYFYEYDMPPVENRTELTKLICDYNDHQEWFSRVNPPERPCWAWEDRDYKFDHEKFKSLLAIDRKPFVFFPVHRNDKIHLIFAGFSQGRFEYTTTTTADQSWQDYCNDKPTTIWLDKVKYKVVGNAGVTFWSNPNYPLTQWVKRVEKE